MNIDSKLLYICIILFILFINIYFNNKLLNKKFYTVNEIEPKLNNIYKYKNKINYELQNILNNTWTQWPEKSLYNEKIGKWNIYPFFAFNIWIKKNCNECPTIVKFLKTIPNLKLATLSKMDPHVSLTPHKGWGDHSNNVIRCHFGLIVPKKNVIFL